LIRPRLAGFEVTGDMENPATKPGAENGILPMPEKHA
jgi:hypothetical protein